MFLRKNCVFEKEEQKSGFLSPSRVKPCLSHVQAVSEVFDLLYDQRYATWRIGHVSNLWPRVHVSDTRTLHKVTVSVL